MWKLQDLESAVIWSKKKVFIKDKAQIASRLRGAERAVLYLGYSCCLSPMIRNSVLEKLRVSRLAVILVRQSRAWRCWSEDRVDKKIKSCVSSAYR